METFDQLYTTRFQKRLRPAAFRIYVRCFGDCKVEDLREHGVGVHILDKEFAIDSLVVLRDGQWVSLQEKYRAHKWLQKAEFTQEYRNAVGSEQESPGEWFKLGAQIYFYGWANQAEDDFQRWVILDIAKYKLLVDRAGGLGIIGTLQHNYIHGRASFYCIPIMALRESFLFTSE